MADRIFHPHFARRYRDDTPLQASLPAAPAALPPDLAPRPADLASGAALPDPAAPEDLLAFLRGLPSSARGAFAPFFAGLVAGWILGAVGVAFGLAFALAAGAFS